MIIFQRKDYVQIHMTFSIKDDTYKRQLAIHLQLHFSKFFIYDYLMC